MNATITWSVTKMGAYPEYMGEQDVVIDVYWSCNGVETIDNVVYKSQEFGVVKLTFNNTSFIPYNQLTPQIVLDWVFSAIGDVEKSNVEKAVQQLIDIQVTPPVINPPLPWVITITQQPFSAPAIVGSNITFTVQAISGDTFTYQWQKDSTNIPNATTNTYTIQNVAESDAGDYTVYLESSQTSITSNPAKLTVTTGSFPQGAPN